MPEEEVKYVDADSYQGRGQDDKLTFKQIVLNQLSRLTLKMSCEWKGGHWETRTKAKGGDASTEKYYVPDTRSEFINSCNCMHDLLIAYFDAKMTKEAETFYKEHEKLRGEIKADVTTKNDLTLKYGLEKKTVLAEDYRKLFRSLNKLLFRLHYIETKTFEEEA